MHVCMYAMWITILSAYIRLYSEEFERSLSPRGRHGRDRMDNEAELV